MLKKHYCYQNSISYKNFYLCTVARNERNRVASRKRHKRTLEPPKDAPRSENPPGKIRKGNSEADVSAVVDEDLISLAQPTRKPTQRGQSLFIITNESNVAQRNVVENH